MHRKVGKLKEATTSLRKYRAYRASVKSVKILAVLIVVRTIASLGIMLSLNQTLINIYFTLALP